MDPPRYGHPESVRGRSSPRELGELNIDGPLEGKKQTNVYVQCKSYGQAERAISNGKLNVLLRLHIRPINVVVFHGPS